MLASQEDAEDVLQDVFAASFNAICADDRPINARPWLYRIARNRCLNHLRRPRPAGQDSMDVFERDGGITTADTVHKREEFRRIVCDVQDLPETQRTALLLREIDALAYDQIAEAMDTTVPSVKSLLVRARVSLAEAAEARLLTCEEVRLELGQVAEGIAKSSPPVRRHLKVCDRCRTFRGELRKTTRALAAIYPVGPFLFLKKLWIAKVGGVGGSAAGAAASSGGAGAGAAGAGMAGAAATAAGGITAGGAVSAGVSTLASKAAAGMAAAVIVTAGAVEVKHANDQTVAPPMPVAVVAPAAPAPPPPAPQEKGRRPEPTPVVAKPEAKLAKTEPVAAVAPPIVPAPEPVAAPAPVEPAQVAPVQEEGSTVTLPPKDEQLAADPPADEPAAPTTPPPDTTTTTEQPPPPPPDSAPVDGTITESDPPPPPPPPPAS